MNRLKLIGAVALLGVLACEEATPPPPVGSIMGQVAIEGTGVDGVSVNLSNGNSTTTSGGGNYRFDNVEGGAYTVTISGYPSDATFDATSAAATISSAGQSVTVNFSGAYIRTASVMGSVTVENMGLGGVTVALSGVSSATAVTDDSGQYAFTGLRMGSYSVEISGFDSDEVGFSNTASAVTVGVGESKIVSFDGTYLRTAGIQGRVSVEGAGLEGVNVSLSVRRDVRIYQEEEMRLVRRQTILLIGILLLGCSQENSDPPGIYRDQEATEMLRAAQIRGAEIILERSDRLLPLLERGKEHALLLPALERELPQLLLDDRMVANLRLTLEAGRVANADLRDLGIEASGTRSLAFVERQLAEYDRAKQLHAEWRDLTVGTLDWTNRARKLTPENWSEDEFQELDRMLTNLSIKRQRLQREFR